MERKRKADTNKKPYTLPSVRPRSARDTPEGVVIEIQASNLLPAICPSCLAPGSRPLTVLDLPSGRPTAEEALYCDLCADAIENTRTRVLALAAACSLLSASVVVALALSWGNFHLGQQLLMGALVSVLPPLLLHLFGAWPREPHALYHLPSPTALPEETPSWRRYWARQRAYAQCVDHARLLDDQPPQAKTKERTTLPAGLALPPVIALCTFIAVQYFGRSTVRVVVPGPEDATFTVDARRGVDIVGTPDENPRGGSLARVLGGVRTLGLIGAGGEPLASTEVTLWPGRDYVFGRLPEGHCLHVEERAYGEAGDRHLLIPIPGPGPIWELEEEVDQWFVPLPARDELPTTGGLRRAIRLLPCR